MLRSLAFMIHLALFSISATEFIQCAELLPAERAIQDVIDHYISQYQQSDNVHTADQASDTNLVRRLTLDLAGRIPTMSEAQNYVNSSDPTKRLELVDRLLSSPDYAYHQRNEIDRFLMGEKREKAWREYLLQATIENRSWDQIFREVMIGREDTPSNAEQAFLISRARDLDNMTSDTSSLFFGVNIACAKCHDHPLVGDWLQDHYFGLHNFFQRTYVTKKKTLAEKFSGQLKFKTTSGEDKQAKFMFLTGTVIDEPKVEKSAEQTKKEDEEVKRQQKDQKAPAAKIPEFSPRRKLVELVLQDGENQFFARSIVNRIWARLMGRGLVHPLDQMHSENPASHPELLDWLTRDLLAHKYDLKRLIRGIALSQSYSHSSIWNKDKERPAEEYFAIAKVRPLSPRQYALSLALASSNPERFPEDMTEENWAAHRKQFENLANGRASQFENPKEHFQVGVAEALFFSNNSKVQNEYLRDASDRLVGYMKKQSNQTESIEVAFWAIHSRPPNAEESLAIKVYLTQRKDRKLEAFQQIVWALLTSPELRFNF